MPATRTALGADRRNAADQWDEGLAVVQVRPRDPDGYGQMAGLGWEYHSTALIDNSASAMTNNTASSWKLYDGAHYSGTAYVAKPWSADADLSSNSGNPSFDNKASSLQPL
ncbi:peptidase inhibitor family I36 protein [Streptomyces sp. NBC_01198]|uniref:peptidase inhibitor family I36 protein n=1 Tax=Streptomyces sp. NBC_01198 TaxID=2903769 RepID=UPI003FA3CA8B